MERWRAPVPDEVVRDWEAFTGGAPIVGLLGLYEAGDVEGLVLDGEDGLAGAMVTWAQQGDMAEVVSLHATVPGSGAGRRALAEVESRLRARGVTTVLIATTNDNADALRFYLREGYRLTAVHLDAMEKVRELKPGVPLAGKDGVPLRDMWELRKRLGG